MTVIHEHAFLALHVLFVGGHAPVKDAIGHGMVNRGRTVVRCFHSGSGGTKLTDTTFDASSGFAAGFWPWIFSDSASVFAWLFLRIGLIRGIGLMCCLFTGGKVGGEVFLCGGCLFDRTSNLSLIGKVEHSELGYIPESTKELKAAARFLFTNHAHKHIMSFAERLAETECL